MSRPSLTPIHEVQGAGLHSPLADKPVRVRGVVTGHSRKGYFIQDPERSADPFASDALFVFSPRRKARIGLLLEITGEAIDFTPGDNGRPTTQLKALEVRLLSKTPDPIEPVWLTAENLPADTHELARVLNGLEGMLVGLEAGSTFVAPSNPFGDYVCVPPDIDALRTDNGGVLVDAEHPERWLPGFRLLDYDDAPRVHVGAKLLRPVVGPLNYRADAFQIAAQGPVEIEQAPVTHDRATLEPGPEHVTILTLNGFNLDAHVEDPDLVLDPDRDVDDDKLYGRFELLARAIVEHAHAPDIVALQEIQDSDGAEITQVVDATATYEQLTQDIRWLGGPEYAWAEVPPAPGDDGGQPGGNIRNAFLYDPKRVTPIEGTMHRIGVEDPAFEGSRKPLMLRFRSVATGAELVVVNVHLASKRHQNSIFAPERPGHDPREETRIRQGRIVHDVVAKDCEDGCAYYITGDFNDFEFSRTLRAICGDDGLNLVDTLPPRERYDYNHRGQLQVLMHGIVPKRLHADGRTEYEILHGNELTGVQPGSLEGKASDHAYVLARLRL